MSSLSGVWDGAPAEIEFCVFLMRSGGNNLSDFPENKLTKLANLLQFKHMLMLCLEDWEGPGPPALLLVYATGRRSELLAIRPEVL